MVQMCISRWPGKERIDFRSSQTPCCQGVLVTRMSQGPKLASSCPDHASTMCAHVPSQVRTLARELRSRMLSGMVKKVFFNNKIKYVLCLVAPILCNPMDYSPPGCSVHGILQVRILEWVARPSSRGSSQLRDQTQVSHIAGGLFAI